MSKVEIGGDARTVPPFNLTKYRIAARIISRMSKHLSDAMLAVADYSKRYGEINTLPITRNHPLAQQYGLSDADFEGRPFIEMPAPPSDVEALGVGLASVFDVAEDDVLRLCALILEDRQELREAVKDGIVDDYLKDHGEQLADKASPQEFVRLLATAIKMAREEFSGEDLLGELRRAWSPETSSQKTPGGDTSDPGENVEHPAAGRPLVMGTATKDGDSQRNDDLSGGSPESSDGPPTTSSPTSPSQTSSPTAV